MRNYRSVHSSSQTSHKEQIQPYWNPVQIDKRVGKRSVGAPRNSKKATDSSTGHKIGWKLSKTPYSISSSPAGALGYNPCYNWNGHQNIGLIKTNYNPIINSWKRKPHPNENCKPSASLLLKINRTSGGGNSSARRIFTAEFKESVVDAFTHDPECVGNQRATARKFRIHRRQVQKWIQQRSPVKVSSSDDPQNTEVPLPPSSGLRSPPKSVMANAINTLLSLRDSVRIKAPWSPQNPSSQTISAALNLGLLSNSASMLHEMDPSPPLNQSSSTNKNANQARQESHRSPRISPQSSNSISPTRNQGSRQYSGNSNGFNNDSDLLSPSEIIDELTYLYPQEDFTLLRKACLKNEITLTKLTNRLAHCYPSTMIPSPSGQNSNGNENGSFKDDFMTQQTLQLIKQQNEYVQMLQQSGVSLPVFPSDMTMAGGLNLSNMADSHHSSSKYPSWFHPLAQAAAAAAAGINIPTGNGGSGSGNTNGKKKNDHLFLSPKTPALSTSKPKTVAAALAASRHSPNIIGSLVGNGKSKKPALPRKRQQRQKSSTITRPSLVMMEDEIDPSSMVETTTTIPTDYGMDLSTVSLNKGNDLTTSKRHIKNEPIYSNEDMPPSSPDSNTNSNGHNLLNAASLTLENYLRNVLPSKKSPNHQLETDSITTLSESDKKKQHVLDAFNDDPEVAGDARGVARKFGLNIRVVLKWLREGPSKSLPALPPLLGKTNGINSILDAHMLTDLNLNLSLTNEHLLRNGDSHSKGGSFLSANIQKKNLPNKRKNTKPNQICDFQNDDLPDDADTVPLDMVVPIKKRRVSNSNAT